MLKRDNQADWSVRSYFFKKLVHYNKVIIISTLGNRTYNYACLYTTLLQGITFLLFVCFQG